MFRCVLGLGMEVGGTLVASLGLGLNLDLTKDVVMNVDGAVDIFSSSCLDIFSYPSTILSLPIFINSWVVKFDKLDIVYQYRKTTLF